MINKNVSSWLILKLSWGHLFLRCDIKFMLLIPTLTAAFKSNYVFIY